MNEAIKLAVEKGGYSIGELSKARDNSGLFSQEDFYFFAGFEYIKAQIVIDPLFWQALGKAIEPNTDMWGYAKSMQYFEILMRGGDTEKFWEELTGKNL